MSEEGAAPERTSPRKQRAATRNRQRDPEPTPAEEASAPKQIKVDAEEQVSNLFKAKPIVAPAADMMQKKLVFKIVNALKDGQNKCSMDAVWKRYMSMNDRETLRKGTNEPLVNNKEELMTIVESLEQDNLCMYAAEEN